MPYAMLTLMIPGLEKGACMIPIRLEMKNFLPYRNPDPLYFEGIHLACLTGSNGAGKSSLLDAITWALWGKARGKGLDDLVHLGQTEMHVVLDFEQEGVTYRVNRQRSVGRRGQSALTLFTVSETGELTNIAGASIAETQAQIETILRLDYDTFVNSAYLQQGKADAFTTKRPAERKRILSDILGLDAWGVYETRAKEQLKEITIEIASLDGAIRDIDAQLSEEPRLKTELKAQTEATEHAQADLDKALAHQKEVEHAERDLISTQKQHSDAGQRLMTYRQDLEDAGQEIEAREVRVAGYEDIIARREEIEAGYQTLKDARDANRQLGELMRRDSDYAQRLSALAHQIDSARRELVMRQEQLQAQLTDLESLTAGDHDQALADVQARLQHLEALQAERDATLETIQQLTKERGEIDGEFKLIEHNAQELKERIGTLENHADEACPLCGQALDDDHRQQVISETQAELSMLRHQWATNRDRRSDMTDQIDSLQTRVKAWGESLSALPALQGEEGALRKQVEQAHDALDKHQRLSADLASVTGALEQEDYAHELRQQMTELTQERQTLAYDDSQHDALNTQIDAFSTYESDYIRLENAQSALEGEAKMLEGARQRHERILKAIDEEEARLVTLGEQMQLLEHQVQEYRRREQEVNKYRSIYNQADERRRTAEQNLKALDRQRQRKAEKQAQIEDARSREALYKELRLAFGKNGVPAMVIDSAIPELEASANQLLARMTDGRMHLRLTTQTSNVDGSTRETLNIEIADEIGTRDYEMYSGGESFRIDFALRVALSEMLARRAGAHLRTLFIDEGFGTQDEEGRNRLVEAITHIQDQFDLILVITHIDELRDAFPVHILIEKRPLGSAIRVV